MTKKNFFAIDFANSLGIELKNMPKICIDFMNQNDFSYHELSEEERDNVILDVLQKIESDKQIIGTSERKIIWERGWSENLREYINSNNVDALTPKFIRPNQAVRLNCNYVFPNSSNFELKYLTLLRSWLFTEYFKEYNSVYEFGCGSGTNLIELCKMYPNKKVYGLDFVQSSCDIVDKLAMNNSWNLHSKIFDMITPDLDFNIDDDSVVFTFGAIEQLASNFEQFLQYLISKKPKLCVHIEPTIELYDKTRLIDYLAIMFHRKRGYTEKFLRRLLELESIGKIDIVKIKRLFFGSLYMEGYSLIVWKPK